MHPRLRARLIERFARILDTEEIHEVLRGYSSRSGSNAPPSVLDLRNLPSPYARPLEPTGPATDPAAGPAIGAESRQRLRDDLIFITGRFRCGSTALWNVFRHVPGCQAFYEPFNERRFFDPSARGAHTDPTHRGVDDYGAEYDGMSGLDSLYDEDWVHRHLYMSADFWAPRMCGFIESLAAQARGRPVLQFNRIDLRLPWLRCRFPNAFLLHLYREPRDQWCSFLMDIEEFPHDAPRASFRDRFYLGIWSRDLRHAFPFLAGADRMHPYRVFYYLWKLSWLFGRRFANRSVAYEDLVGRPRAVLGSLMDELGIEADVNRLQALLSAPPAGRWRRYAGPDWFEAHERACERDLEDFFGNAAATIATGGAAAAASTGAPPASPGRAD